MEYLEIKSNEIPIELLLEADPSKENILTYLSGSWCFVVTTRGKILAACIVKPQRAELAEIYNISVYPVYQGQGIGSKLLKFTISELSKRGIRRIELGTGTFGYQLTYYQRIGFRVASVSKDYFLEHYDMPIFENGIQHKDMLRLYIQI
ncbi:GNAT family N-acetyltransferase [Pseudoalteromonas luteoviolacea]|uniref:GNAT family N-acetyltransferase n=1 Tax=Pseudoalteromonas luteoviolacea TaxID=43657 RepID=UPI001B37226F|nr:GNAT family N-acetyltransferase [Pseudoalteromonas luteoviolacea]MBQ4836594.1 GNAT family N-acetyltransferase [Pseudoalteromonas luteoviolacea]